MHLPLIFQGASIFSSSVALFFLFCGMGICFLLPLSFIISYSSFLSCGSLSSFLYISGPASGFLLSMLSILCVSTGMCPGGSPLCSQSFGMFSRGTFRRQKFLQI